MNLIRNIIWNYVKPWRNEALQKWIKKFKPDVLFFQSGSEYAIFDMVEYICKLTKAKLFMETTDDYVTRHFSLDLFYHINMSKIINRYDRMANNARCIFAIGDQMAEEYKKKFGRGTTCYKVAMNSVELENKVVPYKDVNNSQIILTYAGNLGLNRWKVLVKLGKILEKLRKEGINAILDIYCINKPDKKILKKLTIPNVMQYKGKLNQNQLIEKRNNSDILVHVEAFDKKNINVTRLSISTKIPEYMLSERCILAIGPSKVASIKYIEDNNIGKVVTTLNEDILENEIKEILTNRKERETFIKNAKLLAEQKHSFERNRQMVQEEIKNILK